MEKTKLYFCGDCGTLIGRQKPEKEECLNCGAMSQDIDAIEADFDENHAQRLLRINHLPFTPE